MIVIPVKLVLEGLNRGTGIQNKKLDARLSRSIGTGMTNIRTVFSMSSRQVRE